MIQLCFIKVGRFGWSLFSCNIYMDMFSKFGVYWWCTPNTLLLSIIPDVLRHTKCLVMGAWPPIVPDMEQANNRYYYYTDLYTYLRAVLELIIDYLQKLVERCSPWFLLFSAVFYRNWLLQTEPFLWQYLYAWNQNEMYNKTNGWIKETCIVNNVMQSQIYVLCALLHVFSGSYVHLGTKIFLKKNSQDTSHSLQA